MYTLWAKIDKLPQKDYTTGSINVHLTLSLAMLQLGDMKTVRSQLRIAVATHEHRTGERLGIRSLAEKAGVSVSIVQGLMNNTMKRVPLEDLGKLCTYLHCDVSDILKLEEVPDA
jgi:putative transcriptional regulator